MLLVLDCILRLGVQEQVQLGGIRNPETTSVTGCTNGTRAPVPPHTKATVRDMPPTTEFQGDGPEAFPECGVPLHPHPFPSPHRKQAWVEGQKIQSCPTESFYYSKGLGSLIGKLYGR